MMVIYMKRCFRIDLDIIVIQKSLTQFLKWFNENYIKYLYWIKIKVSRGKNDTKNNGKY